MATGKGILQGCIGRVALLEVDRPVLPHAHPHCHMLIKVGGADSFFSVRDQQVPLAEGTAVVVNSWEPHAYLEPPTNPTATILALYIDIEWLRGIDPSLASVARHDFFLRPSIQLGGRNRKLAHDLADALAAGGTLSVTHQEMTFDLIAGAIDGDSEWIRMSRTERLVGHGIGDFRIRKAMSFIAANLGRRFTMNDVARQSGLSRAHLFELFRKHTGIAPSMYLGTLQMEAAFGAMVEERTTFGTIATRLGFSAQSHFTRFFRNHLGIPPLEYRRALRRVDGTDESDDEKRIGRRP